MSVVQPSHRRLPQQTLLIIGLRGRGIDRGVTDVQQLTLPAYRQLRTVFLDQTPGRAARPRESSPEGNYVRSSDVQWFSASYPAPSLQRPPSS